MDNEECHCLSCLTTIRLKELFDYLCAREKQCENEQENDFESMCGCKRSHTAISGNSIRRAHTQTAWWYSDRAAGLHRAIVSNRGISFGKWALNNGQKSEKGRVSRFVCVCECAHKRYYVAMQICLHREHSCWYCSSNGMNANII